jgi:selenium metabolism protein YedF
MSGTTTAVVINNRGLGHGDAELGERLMASFLRKLWGLADKPNVILFYNTGVHLLAEGSAVLDALTELERAGVDLIACGTCVAHFDIKEKIAVGRVGDMQEIVEVLLRSNKVVTV